MIFKRLDKRRVDGIIRIFPYNFEQHSQSGKSLIGPSDGILDDFGQFFGRFALHTLHDCLS